jgi:hypothetical protein
VLDDRMPVAAAPDIDLNHPVAAFDRRLDRCRAVLGVVLADDASAMGDEMEPVRRSGHGGRGRQ